MLQSAAPSRAAFAFRATLSILAAAALAAAPRSAGASGPALSFTQAQASATILHSVAGVPQPVAFTRALTEAVPSGVPRDTVPAYARLDFAWSAVPVSPATAIVRYAYKFDEPGSVPVEVDASVHSVSFNAGPGSPVVGPGVKNFMLEAVDDLGGTTTVTRFFVMNFPPDTWWAGPDPSLVPVVPGSGGQRYIDVPEWYEPPSIPGSLVSCDSLTQLPAARPQQKTFLEYYDNRIYVRADGDTVNQNSWVVFFSGGFDTDSPYAVRVRYPFYSYYCNVTPIVAQPTGLNGSPVAFVHQVGEQLDGAPALLSSGSFSLPYPNFDPTSVFYNPPIAGYYPMRNSGRAFVLTEAMDGDGALDSRIPNVGAARDIVTHVENGTATPGELAARARILTFYVNRGPVMQFGNPLFFPKPPAYNGGQVAVSPSRVLSLHFYATDPDPADFPTPYPPAGGPSPTFALRYTTTVIGKNADAADVSVSLPPVIGGTSLSQTVNLTTQAPQIVGQDLTVRVQLCDCDVCEDLPGSGRCVTFDIPVRLPATLDVTPRASLELALAGIRPNPGRGTNTTIEFSLPAPGGADLDVFDTSGRRVWSQRATLPAGPQSVRLEPVPPPGVYLLRLTYGAQVRTARVAILR